MAWLLCDERRIAPLELATGLDAASRGLLGRDRIDGAILLCPASSVHTLRMRFAIDVAFCDRNLLVIDVVTMARNRIGRPRLRARAVLEAEASSFEAWGLASGCQLAVSE